MNVFFSTTFVSVDGDRGSQRVSRLTGAITQHDPGTVIVLVYCNNPNYWVRQA